MQDDPISRSATKAAVLAPAAGGQQPQRNPPQESPTAIADFIGATKDVHSVLVATRNLEINLFWQRANYFLVLNSALALGFFNLKEQTYAFAFVALGIIASVLWFLVCLGGKYWQTRWEQRLADFETNKLSGLALFSADTKRIQEDVEAGLHFHNERGFKRWVYRDLVARRFSVSFSMILLSATFILAWLAIGMVRILG